MPSEPTVVAERYQLLRKLGAGPVGQVWEGHDRVLDQPVAVKVVHPHLAADAAFRARLPVLARDAAQVRHPNAATVHDLDEDGRFVVAELVEGRSVRQLLDEGRARGRPGRPGRGRRLRRSQCRPRRRRPPPAPQAGEPPRHRRRRRQDHRLRAVRGRSQPDRRPLPGPRGAPNRPRRRPLGPVRAGLLPVRDGDRPAAVRRADAVRGCRRTPVRPAPAAELHPGRPPRAARGGHCHRPGHGCRATASRPRPSCVRPSSGP